MGEYCKKDAVTYRPTAKGNLEYFYLSGKYDLCIGSKSVQGGKWEPIENEEVSIEEDVCSVNNSCKFDYGKILLILRPSNRQIIAKVKFKWVTFQKIFQISDGRSNLLIEVAYEIDLSNIIYDLKLQYRIKILLYALYVIYI